MMNRKTYIVTVETHDELSEFQVKCKTIKLMEDETTLLIDDVEIDFFRVFWGIREIKSID